MNDALHNPLVLFVAFPGMGLPDLTGPQTVFWAAAKRTTSVCTGAFFLAQAGLLQGKRVATHWGMSDLLASRFPALEVDHDAIFVQQQAIWTSAGVTAGIDLALALVEADRGRQLAMEVARELVVFMKRPGGQAQRSELLRAQTRDTAVFDELHAWLADHLDTADITVAMKATTPA